MTKLDATRAGANDDGASDDGAAWCVVVAAGSGSRFGSAKQFEQLAGARVLDRAVATASACCEGVVVVMPPTGSHSPPEGVLSVPGGATRSESVRAGLSMVPEHASVVLVHDAARPLASAALFQRVIDAVRAGAAAVVPAVEVVDTIRRLGAGVVDRTELRAVQTPQGFAAEALREAHRRGGQATDDAGLVEACGVSVLLVEGERENLKLTERSDLVVAAALLSQRPAGGEHERPGPDCSR